MPLSDSLQSAPVNNHASRKPQELPDPWLFDSEALLRELDRIRELILQIPITNPNATHFGINIAVDHNGTCGRIFAFFWLSTERDNERSAKKHDASLHKAFSQPPQPRPRPPTLRTERLCTSQGQLRTGLREYGQD